MTLLDNLKSYAKQLKAEIITLYLVVRHPRTPWYAKLFIAGVVAYALSPIDLIPDFIPVLGYLDDLIIVPLGIALSIKMIPYPILIECREKALKINWNKKKNWKAGIAIIIIWIISVALVITWVYTLIHK
jgi:uncharacterized membrane protein YkvA (DUF1232 family)